MHINFRLHFRQLMVFSEIGVVSTFSQNTQRSRSSCLHQRTCKFLWNPRISPHRSSRLERGTASTSSDSESLKIRHYSPFSSSPTFHLNFPTYLRSRIPLSVPVIMLDIVDFNNLYTQYFAGFNCQCIQATI